MSYAASDAVGRALRDQLASFRPLLALSMVMTSSRDQTEILRIATTAVPSLGGVRVEAVYFDGDWHGAGSAGGPADADALLAQFASLGRTGGSVHVEGVRWAWAYPLFSLDDLGGYLVVSLDAEPEPHYQFLLNVLAQQTGAALANARLHAQERASAERERASAERERDIANNLRSANLALEEAMIQLAQSTSAVQRSMDIHGKLTGAASAGKGQEGIARTLYQLTGLPVAIEDRHGNLTAWAGPGRPDPYLKQTSARREQVLQRALEARGPIRDRGRLLVVAEQDGQALGTIVLIDSDRTAGQSEKIALEHANTVLRLELVHLRALGEAELRVRRDLVEELLAGTDLDTALERARALGYDLARPHRVVLVTNGAPRANHEAFYHAVRRAVRSTGIGSLLAARPGGVAVLSDADKDWEQFRTAVIAQMGPHGSCRVGVGAPCTQPPEFPRSHSQALLALKMQVATGSPEQATLFEDLGIYQLLSEIPEINSVEVFIRRWLGPLIDYDTDKGARLVDTLSCYLECGGNYDSTAKKLSLHRSTLRYRLQRIRDISGRNLNEPNTRFNLQLATRAWTTVHALRQQL
ncbi:MAG TPA: helix-turn-helix domain-containing protein [Pseudonocardiaceae bacterium]|nr:helix-turn-helix domain-containing protein [Pseudonocardiaceae bacterium]